ncbi:MAG: FAD-dependent oxidoreductase [Desulfomicrobium escambiense]|nr:FAD-dependent oxidoreductase [Desulfomicrobium escambiense]
MTQRQSAPYSITISVPMGRILSVTTRERRSFPVFDLFRSYTSIVKEDPVTKNVTIRYSTPDDGVKEEEFDMVVLSIGLNPPEDVKGMAEKFGIELNTHDFCKLNPVNPMVTNRPGIFVSGGFQGPIDIPESVFTASGARLPDWRAP